MSRASVVVSLTLLALARPLVGQAPRRGDPPRDYEGTYQWADSSCVYLQRGSEFTGTNDLVAFDESGDVRILHPR